MCGDAPSEHAEHNQHALGEHQRHGKIGYQALAVISSDSSEPRLGSVRGYRKRLDVWSAGLPAHRLIDDPFFAHIHALMRDRQLMVS
jgi:hypothetical protein